MHLKFDANHVIVSVSGGKDSAALLAWAVAHFPKEMLIAVHAQIDIDWAETLPIVKAQCAHFGVKLKVVRAIDKDKKPIGFLDILTRKRHDRKTGEEKENQFPSMSSRWCTSLLKTGPIDKFCRGLTGRVLVLIGERREESPDRAKLEMWRPDEKNSIEGRAIVKYSPLLDWKAEDIWRVILDKNIPTHPCYSWGVSRASCAICIFSSDKEIGIAAKMAPDIVAKYIDAESKISHSFRYKKGTRSRVSFTQTIAQILGLKKGAA